MTAEEREKFHRIIGGQIREKVKNYPDDSDVGDWAVAIIGAYLSQFNLIKAINASPNPKPRSPE